MIIKILHQIASFEPIHLLSNCTIPAILKCKVTFAYFKILFLIFA
jgi:hypothetical protein